MHEQSGSCQLRVYYRRWPALLRTAVVLIGLPFTMVLVFCSGPIEQPLEDEGGVVTETVAPDPTTTSTLASEPTPSPTSTPTPTLTPSPTPTLVPTDTPEPTPTPSPTPTIPRPTSWPTPPHNQPPPIALEEDGRWIEVDLSEQKLIAYEWETPVRYTLVSTGLPYTPTPTGLYRVLFKLALDDMEGPGYYLPDVPHSLYFLPRYALHGTYWHDNFGQPMSHGCVNLPNSEAEWLYVWADVGTPVYIHH